MINCCPMIIIFGLITAAASVGGCYVHPASVVVTIGERVLLTCSTKEGSTITSWDIFVPIDSRRKTTVYTAPIYKRDGTVGTPEKVAEGYFATRPAENETTLHMNRTILSQAGSYLCTCDLRSTAESTVVVLDSEPKFSTDYSVTDDKSVTFSCFLSFNASSDVSCELKIEDASGSTVARRNESTVNNGLIVCNLTRTIIANASYDQWPTCNVTLSTKGVGMIFSRLLNATVEWKPISSTADFFSSGGRHSATGEEAFPKLAISLSVTIIAVVVIIIIAGVVVFFIRSRIRDKMLIRQHSVGQPVEQSSNSPHRPATNQYNKNKIGSPIPKDPATSCNKAVQQDNTSLKDNELTLFENDLYSATPKLLDPSDGYYADGPVYNDIE